MFEGPAAEKTAATVEFGKTVMVEYITLQKMNHVKILTINGIDPGKSLWSQLLGCDVKYLLATSNIKF